MTMPERNDNTKVALRTSELAERVRGLEVEDSASYYVALAGLRDIRLMKEQAQELLTPVVRAANEAHKAAKAQEHSLLDPLDEASLVIKKKLSDYLNEQSELIAIETFRMAVAGESAPTKALMLLPLKQKGEVRRRVLKVESVDLKELAEAVASGIVSADLITFSLSGINRMLNIGFVPPGVKTAETWDVYWK